MVGSLAKYPIFAIEKEQPVVNEMLENFIGVTSAASVVVNATSATKKIVKRELLQQEVRKLEYDLAMDELDKPKELVKK